MPRTPVSPRDFPDSAPHEEVRKLLAGGIREGWDDTIDRLVAAFAGLRKPVERPGTATVSAG